MLRKLLDSQKKHFDPGGPLHRFHPLYEAVDSFFYSTPEVTKHPPHVRDALDLKRMMGIVVFALLPCVLMAMYNTGLQANQAIAAGQPPTGWRASVVTAMGFGFLPDSILSCFLHGALCFVPVLVVTFVAGGTCEVIFSIVRKHEVNEGFFVTGFLFPLILPPTIPLWQVALGIVFGVVIGKEIFGGTGMNVLNPALLARAFLFFAYPAQFSGDAVWVAVDGVSGPTMMARAMVDGTQGLVAADAGWWDAFLGFIPGSMGETSTLLCLVGAVILIVTRVGSWRTMAGIVIGSLAVSLLLNALSRYVQNPYFDVPFHWHVVLGGWAFGAVFMATDPVSSAQTEKGKWIFGVLIGVLAIGIRVVNPAFPDGMMLAILFMNVFAPVIDYCFMQANIKRRAARHVAAS